jgi:DsbC/DsbD-like thiol-disulfide interchange protein
MRRLIIPLLLSTYLVAASPQRVVEGKHVRVVLSQSPGSARSGSKVRLLAEVQLPKGMHVYAPGIEAPYRPIQLKLEPTDGVRFSPVKYPSSKKVRLEAIDETVPVFTDAVTLETTATVSSLASPVEVRGSLNYQVCDDRICYRPEQIPLSWRIEPAK